MSRGREFRIEHESRVRAKARKVIRFCWGMSEAEADKLVGRLANNMTGRCCNCCRNPRRLGEGISYTERRQGGISD